MKSLGVGNSSGPKRSKTLNSNKPMNKPAVQCAGCSCELAVWHLAAVDLCLCRVYSRIRLYIVYYPRIVRVHCVLPPTCKRASATRSREAVHANEAKPL